MERKHYLFEGCGGLKILGVTIYQGWFFESDMVTMAQGIVVGLRQYCKSATVAVYEEINDTWHLVRVQR